MTDGKIENTGIVSVIIPAYNEENSIAKVLDGLKFLSENCEIIVIDDGSIDNTAEIVKNYQNIKLIRHESNLGYGASLKTGVKCAAGDIIVITDADGTYPNERIPEFIKILRDTDSDMIVGARTGEHVKIPLIRKLPKWFINKLANYLSGTKIPDLNSGFRAMRKEVINKFLRILPDGFSFTTTITLAMLSNHYKVRYIPINYFKRTGKSKISPIKDTVKFIQLTIRTIMYFDPLKVFLPVSLPLIILGAFLIFFQAILYRNISTVSVIVTVTGIQLLAIGMLADLIDKRS